MDKRNLQLMPVLLTASVDTRGMKGGKFTATEREKMYIDTLNYYIRLFTRKQIKATLVFVENSGWPQERVTKALDASSFVSVEYIALPPEHFVQERGKSYNEMLLMDEATLLSDNIRRAGRFFKVTGRYPILNLDRLMREAVAYNGGDVRYYADCKDHRVYEMLHLPINGHSGESRYFAVSMDFYDKHFRGRYQELDDFKGRNVEGFYLELIRKTKHERGVHGRYKTQARFSGKNGHNLGNGIAFFYSTDNDSLALKSKVALRQLFRWILPWWWC